MTEQEHSQLQRYADYVRKADEADQTAADAHHETVRISFVVIGEHWRQLAEQVKRQMQRGI